MNRCDDVNKSCFNCNKAKIIYWDNYHYYATFECPYHLKNTGTLIGYLTKHNCEYFENKEKNEDGNDD